MTTAYRTRTLNVTVLTVGIDPEMVAQLLDAAQNRNWAITEAAFDGYISAKHRPRFGEDLKSGDGCVSIIDFDEDPQQAVEATAYLQQVFAGRIAVVALSAKSDTELMLLAMRSGCTEFLTKSLDGNGLRRLASDWSGSSRRVA